MPGPYRAAKTKKDIRPFTSGCPFYCLKASLFTFFSKKVNQAGLLADVGEDAAVNVEDQAVDEVGSLGGEEHGGAAQILGFAPALSRGLGNDELVERMTAAVGLDAHAEVRSAGWRCSRVRCRCTGCCTRRTRRRCSWSASSGRPWQRRRRRQSRGPARSSWSRC